MRADLPPGRPCPREGLGNQLLCGVLVTHTHQDREKALILEPVVELREGQSLVIHTQFNA
jgi:hypothetical protein